MVQNHLRQIFTAANVAPRPARPASRATRPRGHAKLRPAIWGLVVLGLALFLAKSALAQPAPEAPLQEGEVSKFGRRYDAFRFLFSKRTRFEPETLNKLKFGGKETWKQWAIVVLGHDSGLELLSQNGVDLTQFLNEGGAVLIASDYPTTRLVQGQNIRIHRGPVRVAEGNDGFQGHAALPIVENFNWVNPITGNVMTDVRALAFNRPGFVQLGDEIRSNAVARFPQGAATIEGPLSNQQVAIAGMSFRRNGRLLVVADQSLFINEMNLELDNFIFAQNVVSWLMQNGRTHVLFVEDGVPARRWIDDDFREGRWNDMTNDDLMAMVNQLITGLEDEDTFNRVITDSESRFSRRGLMRRLTAALALLALVALGIWLLRARKTRAISKQTRAAPPRDLPGETVLDQRRHAILRMGNYLDPARRLAENHLRLALGQDAASLPPKPAPEIAIAKRVPPRERRRLRKIALGLWNIVHGKKVGLFDGGRFLELQQETVYLEQMERKGSLRWQFPGDEAAPVPQLGTTDPDEEFTLK